MMSKDRQAGPSPAVALYASQIAGDGRSIRTGVGAASQTGRRWTALLHQLDKEGFRMKSTPGSTKTDPRPDAGTRIMIRIT